jgi:hypothetical protein
MKQKSFFILANILGWGQGIYYLLTGVWPLVHISSFMAVTGPKTDIWLVKMVGLLAAAIGLFMARVAYRKAVNSDTAVLAVCSALAFAGIDIYYASIKDIIWNVYLLDAVAEAAFIVGWGILAVNGYYSADKSKYGQK